jgi:putative flippase GtrA
MPEGQDFDISRPWAPILARLGGRNLRQIVLFLIVGVSNTVLTYVAYLALLQIVHYAWAFTGAFVLGLLFTGLLNIRVTFGHHHTLAAWVVFSAYYGLYYVFALMLLRLLVDEIGIDARFAPLVMLPVVVPINFLMTRLIVHRFARARS